MDPSRFTRIDPMAWQIEPTGAMRVPGVIYADEGLSRDMDEKVYEQTVNVATLPGIIKAVYVMPDAHWGYGFPIGGVAAFDADEGYVEDDTTTWVVHPVEIPSAQNTGIKADIDLVVEEGAEGDVGLLFDADATFANVIATGNGRVKMPPVIKVRPMNQHQNQNQNGG